MNYTEEKIEKLQKYAENHYKKGMYVNQQPAYNGAGGDKERLINDDILITTTPSEYVNVSIGGYGVYHSEFNIWAPIVGGVLYKIY